MSPKSSFIHKRIASFGFAFNGIWQLFRKEKNAQIHLIAAIIAIATSAYLRISAIEWLFIIACISSVITAEGINSALEELADFIHPEKHDKIKLIKDLSAGAVLVTAIGSATIGLIIFIPKIILLW